MSHYTDHCHVNDVIGGTIDAVQDQVIEPAMPVMDISIDQVWFRWTKSWFHT